MIVGCWLQLATKERLLQVITGPGEARAGDFVNGPNQGLALGLFGLGDERVGQSLWLAGLLTCLLACWQTESDWPSTVNLEAR